MPANRWVVLALLFTVRVSTGIQYQAVASLSPQLMSSFVLSIADIGLLIGLYHAPGTMLAFPGGAIGAWLGERPVALIGLALMVIGEIAAATAPSWPVLMGARILAGTGGILLNVMIIKMVADWFPSEEMATAMAIIGNSAPAGVALSLATIPWIASAGDRVLASISVVAYLALAFAALAAAYKAPDEARAVAQRQSLWPERRVVVCLITAGLIYGLYNVGLVTILAFGPLMLAERGWSFAAGSSATSLALWIVTISLPAGGLLADRIGRRAVVLVCGLVAFAATMAAAPRVDAAFAIFLLLGITSGLPCGAIMALPTQVLAPETRSAGMGIMFTVYYAVNVGGPWLVGVAAKQAGSARFAFDASAISLGVAVILWLFFRHQASRSPFIKPAHSVRLPVEPRTEGLAGLPGAPAAANAAAYKGAFMRNCQTRPVERPASSAWRAGDTWRARLAAAAGRWWSVHQRQRLLGGLSDHVLKDIGLFRIDDDRNRPP